MNRLIWIVSLVALLFVGFGPVSVRAFDIPGMGDDNSDKDKKKKKKKKDDTKKEDSGDTKTDDSKTAKDDSKTDSSDTTAAAKDGGAADGDAKQANIEAMIETCLAAYNADDIKTMAPNFATTLDKNAYKSIYAPYKEKFGTYVAGSKKSVKIVTRFTPDNKSAHLGFNGEFSKAKKACIDCNVMNQNGKWKIVGLDFGDNGYNFPEEGAASDNGGVVIKGNTVEMKVPKSLWDAPYMKEIKVGDFLEYEMPAAPGMKSHTEVVEIGDHTMTMLSRSTIPGMGVQEGKSKQIYSEPDPDTKDAKEHNNKKVETKTFDDKIKIGDKGEFAATRTECYEDGKLISKMWTCKDVPLGGMVRGEGPDGKAYQQLVNFGRGK